ncbi:hypothetical protein HPB50_009604 [Hyalomma asiaticum]|uniref:Uncharacterized protein n=1 Tax=Hyalomma asiaticum TaxID=266040 RepID=A0ACB7TF81_HYAAI|nr:hypothetical protein HPB50_009604 [Hyalomma asiaticum]
MCAYGRVPFTWVAKFWAKVDPSPTAVDNNDAFVEAALSNGSQVLCAFAPSLGDYTQLKAPDDIDNMTSQLIEGSYSPAKDVPNPFHYRIHLTRADKIKVALMTVTLVPVRIVLIIFFLLLTWLGCYLGQLGLSHKDRTEKPLTGFRSFKGQLASQKEAPVLVVGPHSSLLDGVVVLLLGGLMPVAKAGSEYVPIFGRFLGPFGRCRKRTACEANGCSNQRLNVLPHYPAAREAIQSASRKCVLKCIFCAGIWVRTVGRAARPHEAPILVVAPHSSFFDTVAAMLGNPVPSAVVRSKSKGMFFLGKKAAPNGPWALTVCSAAILNFTQPVYVKRSDPNSRQNTVREITRRATSKEPWSQVIIFPEGTCTNRSCLITFKQGAFVPGVPVQPVLIRYPNELYLPVYVPSEREKKDPKLYAENVRCLMAKALRIPLSSYSYDDLKQTDVENSGRVKTVVCNRLQQLISRNCIQLQDIGDVILKVKAAIKNRESSRVSFLEFVAILGVPSDHISKNVFEAFDISLIGRDSVKVN